MTMTLRPGRRCSTSGKTTTSTYAYDGADRLTSDTAGSYSYDVLGRTGSVPAGDATGTGTRIRSSDDLAGLILMGARLYSPATGRFLSVDSVYGGNDNAYNYPNDPIGLYDLNGQFWGWLSKTAHAVGEAGKWVYNHPTQVASLVAAGACIAASDGLCGPLAYGALAGSFASRTYNFIKHRDYRTGRGWLDYGAGVAADVLASRIPAAKSDKAIARLPRHASYGRHALRYSGRAARSLGQLVGAAWGYFG